MANRAAGGAIRALEKEMIVRFLIGAVFGATAGFGYHLLMKAAGST
ncbi:MAG: hypothetical protein HND42_07950 [Armatimonadetes bacterium]|nr:hypothetical protein [Armatimonadota bacterium]